MPKELLYIWIILLVAAGFVMLVFMVERFLAPSVKSTIKADPYECGVPIIGQPWVKTSIRYYIFALLFLIFDIETVFMFPWAVVFHKLGLLGLIEMGVFIAILLVGYAYVWKKGALEWE